MSSQNNESGLNDRRGKEKLEQQEYQLKIDQKTKEVKPSKSEKAYNIAKGIKKTLDRM